MRFGIKTQLDAQLLAIFRSLPEIEEVLVFGSRAKGNFRPNSDVDFAFKGQLSEKTMSAIFWEIEDLDTLLLFDLIEFEKLSHQGLREHIERVGQVFYQKAPLAKAA